MQEGCGYSLASNVAPDPSNFLLLFHPGHVISGDHGTINDGGRGQGEGRLGLTASKRLIGIASILIRVSLALLLIDSIVFDNLKPNTFNKVFEDLVYMLLPCCHEPHV